MHEVHHISVSIDRRPAEVYECASGPFGKIRVRFAPRNSFGVMDHDAELESGLRIHNPMRIVPNGEGSEFVFTLIRQRRSKAT